MPLHVTALASLPLIAVSTHLVHRALRLKRVPVAWWAATACGALVLAFGWAVLLIDLYVCALLNLVFHGRAHLRPGC